MKNVDDEDVNAITWGVFPAKEVLQPTVVDHRSFEIWTKEIFDHIRKDWMEIYEDGSKSQTVLNRLIGSYYLINIVENDYIGGDLNKVLLKFIDENQELVEILKEAEAV